MLTPSIAITVVVPLAIQVTGQFTYYVDSSTGSDSNSGRSPTTAFATVAKALSVAVQGESIGLARGSTFFSTNSVSLAIPYNNITLDAYGNAALPKPVVSGSTAFSTASWTLVTGTEYSTPLTSTFSGPILWVATDNGVGADGNVITLFKGTAGSLTANQYAIVSNVLHINFSRAPLLTDVVQVPPAASAALFAINGKAHTAIKNISYRYAFGDGIQVAGSAATDDVLIYGCEGAYCYGGLIHGGTGGVWSNGLVDNCYLHDQYSAQNGLSVHCDVGPCSVTVRSTIFRRIAGHGTTSHDNATFMRYQCVYDAAHAFCLGGGQGGGVGRHDHIGCQWVNEPPEFGDNDYHFHVQEGGTAPNALTVFNMKHCSFARGTGTHLLRGLVCSTGVWTLRDVSLYGTYSIGLYGSGLTLDSDYVFTGGASLNTFQWTAGAHDQTLSTTPYNNSAANDLSPKAGSVLLGAGSDGHDVGYTGA